MLTPYLDSIELVSIESPGGALLETTIVRLGFFQTFQSKSAWNSSRMDVTVAATFDNELPEPKA